MNKNGKRCKTQRKNRQNKNLPRYDLAQKPISSGRQTNYGIDTSGFRIQPGQDISPATNAFKQQIIPSALLNGGAQGLTLAQNFASNYTSAAAANAANIAAAKAAGYTGEKAVEQFATNGGTLVSSGMSTLGNVLSGAGALYGGLQLGTGLYNMHHNYRDSSDMMDASGMITQSSEGVNYDAYSGFNAQNEIDYVKAQNTSDTINNTISGVGAGASLGTLAGSIVPGLGNIAGGVIGGLLGGIGGLFGSLFGGKSRRRKVEREIKDTLYAQQHYNQQAESRAGSEGLRNKFNISHGEGSGLSYGNCGKDAGGSMKKFNSGKQAYSTVWTPAGQQFGKVNSLVGKGESLIDYTTGQATYIDKGTKRVDNQPSIAKDGDQIVIAGNKVDPTNGLSYAEQAAPITKNIEKLNKIIDNTDPNTNTGRLQIQQAELAKEIAFRDMKQITDRQRLHNMYDEIESTYNCGKNSKYSCGKNSKYSCGKNGKYNCGKNSKYDEGKIDWMSLAANGLSMLAPLSQYFYYKGHKPIAENPYVGNANARQALNMLGSLKDNPYDRIQAIKNANRQAIYSINQSGAYSPGQRMAMLTANNSNYAKNIAAEYAKSADINRNLSTQYANMLYNAGEADRKYAFDALNIQQQRRREALAAQRLGIETAQKGMLNVFNNTMQDLWKSKYFNESQRFNNAQLKLWGDQQKIDKAKIYNDMLIGKPN